MKKEKFNIMIKASSAKVWQVLWSDITYRKWCAVFKEGSYAVSDWKTGSKIHFLSPEGDGMFGIIAECRDKEFMAFRHMGIVRLFKEQPESVESTSLSGSMETYALKNENGITSLEVTIDLAEEYKEYFNTVFPKALELVKNLAEQPVALTVEADVSGSIDKIWNNWTMPEHITKWNNASEDWHTPKAENDLRSGGKFVFRMEAKDGSFGFDFGGTYTEVIANRLIAYKMGDGRKAKIDFIEKGHSVKIRETFEAEEMNSLELQQKGWQSILNNFKKYSESNS